MTGITRIGRSAAVWGRFGVSIAAIALSMCGGNSTYQSPTGPAVSSSLTFLPGDVAWVHPEGTRFLLLPPGIDTGGKTIVIGEKTTFEPGAISSPSAMVEAYRQGTILTATVWGLDLTTSPSTLYASRIAASSHARIPVMFGGWGGFTGSDPPRISVGGTTMVFVTPWTTWAPEGDFTTLESLPSGLLRVSGEGFHSATGAIQARTILVTLH